MLAQVLEKAVEIPEAIRKGKEDAIKRMIKIDINEEGSISPDITGVYGSGTMLLKKAKGRYWSNSRRSCSCCSRISRVKISIQNV